MASAVIFKPNFSSVAVLKFNATALSTDNNHVSTSKHHYATSSASLSHIRPPSSFVKWHKSVMFLMVGHCLQSHSSNAASPHLYKLARHGP